MKNYSFILYILLFFPISGYRNNKTNVNLCEKISQKDALFTYKQNILNVKDSSRLKKYIIKEKIIQRNSEEAYKGDSIIIEVFEKKAEKLVKVTDPKILKIQRDIFLTNWLKQADIKYQKHQQKYPYLYWELNDSAWYSTNDMVQDVSFNLRISLKPKNLDELKIHFLFKDKKINCMPYPNKGFYEFSELPKNENGTVVAVGRDNKNFYYGSLKLNSDDLKKYVPIIQLYPIGVKDLERKLKAEFDNK